jgi:hypothetical protein
MSLNYVILVNDNGELKMITADEIDNHHVFLAENALEDAIQYILDEREMSSIPTYIDTRISDLPEHLPPGTYTCTLEAVEKFADNHILVKAKFVGEKDDS